MVNINHLERPAVYALHGGDFRFVYVGVTRKNSRNRLYEHISRARAGHTSPVYVWMRAHGIERVEVVDLESLEAGSDAAALEARWIARLIAEGHPITNRLGRDGVPGSHSPESKALMSARMRGRVSWIAGRRADDAGWTPERRRAQSERMRTRAAG